MPDYIRFPLVLLIVTLISATCLSLIDSVTAGKIEEQARLKVAAGEKTVFPLGTPEDEYRTPEITVDGKTSVVEYKEVKEGDELLGYLVKGAAAGYSSTIEVLVGVGKDAAVKGVAILNQKETPGLGTRIEEVKSDNTWFRIIAGTASLGRQPGDPDPVPWYTEQYRGKKGAEVRLKESGGTIDAITGATISSRAVSEAVFAGVDNMRNVLEKKAE